MADTRVRHPGVSPLYDVQSNLRTSNGTHGNGVLSRDCSAALQPALKADHAQIPLFRPDWGLARSGGARRDRTDDFLLAKQALSQLSYGPEPVVNPVLVVRRSLDSVDLQLMFRRLSAKRGGPGKT